VALASAEREVHEALDALKAPFVVHHDLVLPRTGAPVEHLVLGPTGVFLVEAKRYANPVIVRGRVAHCGGRSMGPVVDQAARRAAAVRSVLGVEVRAVLCVLSPLEPDGKRDRLVVDGVELTSARWLTRVLTRKGTGLSYEALVRLAALTVVRFAPKERRPCACGGDLVVRRRKSDGAALLTCSRHPVCRVAEPVALRSA